MNLTQVINSKRVAIANDEIIKKNYSFLEKKWQKEGILSHFLKEIGFEKEQSNKDKDGGFVDVYGSSSMIQVKIVEEGGPFAGDWVNVLIFKKYEDGLDIIGNLWNVREDSDADYTDTGFSVYDEDGEQIDLTYEEGFNLILDKIREA